MSVKSELSIKRKSRFFVYSRAVPIHTRETSSPIQLKVEILFSVTTSRRLINPAGYQLQEPRKLVGVALAGREVVSSRQNSQPSWHDMGSKTPPWRST